MNTHDLITFIRYTLVAMIGLVCDMTTLFLLVEFVDTPYLLATAVAFMVAVVVNFNLHKRWTFHDKSHDLKRQFTSFFVISVMNFMLTLFFMYIFVDIVQLWYILAKLITATLVLIFSYIMNRLWTFKRIKIRGRHV
jgi:putative flippase GtrA